MQPVVAAPWLGQLNTALSDFYKCAGCVFAHGDADQAHDSKLVGERGGLSSKRLIFITRDSEVVNSRGGSGLAALAGFARR